MNKNNLIGINLFSLDHTGRAGGTLNYMVGLLSALNQLDQKNQYIIICPATMKSFWKKIVPNFNIVTIHDHDIDVALKFSFLGIRDFPKKQSIFYKLMRWVEIIFSGKMTIKEIGMGFGSRLNHYWIEKKNHKMSNESLIPDFLTLEECLKTFSIDIWFCPIMELSPLSGDWKSVVSIPDLQHIAYPEYFSLRHITRRQFSYPLSCQNADMVVTVSEYSRQQFIHEFQLDPQKIISIYHGVDFELSQDYHLKADPILDLYGIQKPYICYTANLWPHKNHWNLIQVMDTINQSLNNPIQLVLTGYPSDISLVKKIKNKALKSTWLKYLGYIPRAHIKNIIANSRLFVFPSLYEGFGIPIVEAMALKVPIIASKKCSIPEILGPNGVYFDPENLESMEKKIREGMAWPDEVCQKIVQSQLDRLPMFNYSLSAQKFMDLWDEVLSRPKNKNEIIQGITLDRWVCQRLSIHFHTCALKKIILKGKIPFKKLCPQVIEIWIDDKKISTIEVQKSGKFNQTILLPDFYQQQKIHHLLIESNRFILMKNDPRKLSFKLTHLSFEDERLGTLLYSSLS